MWHEKNNRLVKLYDFPSFTDAIDFVNRVAKLAEQKQHHPLIEIDFNKVTISLFTHEEGDSVTDKDRALSALIDGILI